MNAPKNILVPTDLSYEADQALAHAIYLARIFGADVHLLHVMPGEGGNVATPADIERVHSRMGAAAARRLETVSGEKSEREVMLHTRVMQGMAVVPAVLAYAMRCRIDLIVMGARGPRGKDRPQWQRHSEEIARTAAAPVLTVGRDVMAMPGLIRRVLVPLGFDKSGERGLEIGRRIAHNQRANLDVLHVVQPMISIEDGRAAVRARSDFERYVREQMLAAYKADRGPDVKYRLHVRYGDPAGEIASFATENRSSLIVMTTHGATGLQFAMDGSIAATVVGLASCPVLTVKNNFATAALTDTVTVAAGLHKSIIRNV